jgi:hypothetical protein
MSVPQDGLSHSMNSTKENKQQNQSSIRSYNFNDSHASTQNDEIKLPTERESRGRP